LFIAAPRILPTRQVIRTNPERKVATLEAAAQFWKCATLCQRAGMLLAYRCCVTTRREGLKPGRFALILAIAVLISAGFAGAQPEILTFSGSGPHCPSSALVNQYFLQLVGPGPEPRGSAAASATPTADGRFEFVVRIRSARGGGERRFFAERCELGAKTAALIAAISLFPERASELVQRTQKADLEAGSAEPSPRPVVASGKPIEALPRNRRAPDRASPPRADRAAGIDVTTIAGVGAGVDATSMPNLAVALAVAFGLEFEERALVEIVLARPFGQTEDQPFGRSARFEQLSLGAHGCYFLTGPRLVFAPCAGATVVRIVGEGRGSTRTHQRAVVYGGPALGAALRARATEWLRVGVHAEAFVALRRTRFFQVGTEVHRPGQVGLTAFAGAQVAF
jgi:hypothetical protein